VRIKTNQLERSSPLYIQTSWTGNLPLKSGALTQRRRRTKEVSLQHVTPMERTIAAKEVGAQASSNV
jgi:hypothetical protein